MSSAINRMTLRSVFPADIISKIYEYDNTYREIFSQVICSAQFSIASWNRWKTRFFSEELFKTAPIIAKKCEAMFDYLSETSCLFYRSSFPTNISVFIKEKLFYYSNCAQDKSRAIMLYQELPDIVPNTFEVTFEFSDDYYANFSLLVFTKEQYYNRYVNVDEDRNTDDVWAQSVGDFYIVEKIYSMFLPDDEPLI